jgi:hypothetical protein
MSWGTTGKRDAVFEGECRFDSLFCVSPDGPDSSVARTAVKPVALTFVEQFPWALVGRQDYQQKRQRRNKRGLPRGQADNPPGVEKLFGNLGLARADRPAGVQ